MVLLSCFRILIELVGDTESISSNYDCKMFLFVDKLIGSNYTLVSSKTMLDSRDLLRAMQKNQLFDCGNLITGGLHHHSIYS